MWRVVAASAQGTAHVTAGIQCQDCCDHRIVKRDGSQVLLCAVADGAGSASRGFEGADTVCGSIMDLAMRALQGSESLGRLWADGCPIDWVSETRERLASIAERHQLPLREFATTLLFAMAGHDQSVFLQIGDGAIVIDEGEGTLEPVFWPHSGEYANTTFFVTDENYLENVSTECRGALRSIALLTDGLERLALRFAERAAHAPFFAPMIARVQQSADQIDVLQRELSQFLDSAPVNARTDDDKTLILATRTAITNEPNP